MPRTHHGHKTARDNEQRGVWRKDPPLMAKLGILTYVPRCGQSTGWIPKVFSLFKARD